MLSFGYGWPTNTQLPTNLQPPSFTHSLHSIVTFLSTTIATQNHQIVFHTRISLLLLCLHYVSSMMCYQLCMARVHIFIVCCVVCVVIVEGCIHWIQTMLLGHLLVPFVLGHCLSSGGSNITVGLSQYQGSSSVHSLLNANSLHISLALLVPISYFLFLYAEVLTNLIIYQRTSLQLIEINILVPYSSLFLFLF